MLGVVSSWAWLTGPEDGAVLGPGSPGSSLFGLVLGAVLGAEVSGIPLFGRVLRAVLGVDGTVVGRWEKLSAGPECQYFKGFALRGHTSAFAFAFVFRFPFAYDWFQVIEARVETPDWR